MTKNEKELITKIKKLMDRKKVEGNPANFYTVTKRSNNDYLAELKVGNRVFGCKGKTSKDAIKNLIKEIK